MFEILKAIILGIIQGITEWLPISSTGHLLLADEFIKMDFSKDFIDMFMVVIQLGSILAVLVLHFHKLNPFSSQKSTQEKSDTYKLWLKVIVAAVPAGIVGVLFDDLITDLLYNPYVIAATLIIYGVLFIVIENRKKKPNINTLNEMDYKTALGIGAFQILALVPGTSRSGSTILGATLLGNSRFVSAEFSFFLAIPMMLGASGLKLLKFALKTGFGFTGMEFAVLLTGTLVAFLVSVFAIKFLMSYIKKHDFKAFGYYRIVLGIAVLAFFLITGYQR